jgi:small membrane protein
MKPIQFILVLFMLIIAGAYFFRLRKKTYDRLIVIFFIVAGVILVMVPDLSAEIARLVGVGRGVDLVLYLGLLGISFVCLLLYSKIRELEATLTDLVRSIAITEANHPKKNSVGEITFPNQENKENHLNNDHL